MIELSDIAYSWPDGNRVLDGLSLKVPQGQHVALIGPNGAGKSTLALIVKGLLVPREGTVTVDGIEASDDNARAEILKRVGLVFQSPEDTIVATTVERELAFGLENLGVPRPEMIDRVVDALDRFDLARYRHANPLHLSGGEMQRLALAAVMIMRPGHLILDEPTSLLDPWSRGHILDLIHDAAKEGATVLHITQFESEARAADRVITLDGGVICDDCPAESFVLWNPTQDNMLRRPRDKKHGNVTPVLEAENVSYIYDAGSPGEHAALNGVTLSLPRGSVTAVIGPTGSGKTTLLEIAAGVTRPTSGRVRCDKASVRAMAFQFPEDQMFGETVASYVAFGPRNMGISERDTADIVARAVGDVGLDSARYLNRDPLTLSGGERRRAALAGVLAMKPDILILDEPFAGLDREGSRLVTGFLDRYTKEGGTLLFSTHDLEAARAISDRAVVMENGVIETAGDTGEVFTSSPLIASVSR